MLIPRFSFCSKVNCSLGVIIQLSSFFFYDVVIVRSTIVAKCVLLLAHQRHKCSSIDPIRLRALNELKKKRKGWSKKEGKEGRKDKEMAVVALKMGAGFTRYVKKGQGKNCPVFRRDIKGA